MRRLEETLNNIHFSHEIIVVNDGSTDNTLFILEEIAKIHTFVTVIGYAKNRGKGYAVKKGVESSSGKYVIFLDGDLDIPPEMISSYIGEIQWYDLVIASKRHPSSRITAPVTRKFLSKMFALMVKYLLRLDVKDTQTGLKAGNGWILRSMFQSMTVKRYAFDVELITLASRLKLMIKEMPIEVTVDRRFKMKEIIIMFKDVLMIYWKYRRTTSKNLNQLMSIIDAEKNGVQGRILEASNEETLAQTNVLQLKDQIPYEYADQELPNSLIGPGGLTRDTT